jgi:hypothetical protein
MWQRHAAALDRGFTDVTRRPAHGLVVLWCAYWAVAFIHDGEWLALAIVAAYTEIAIQFISDKRNH